MIFDEDFTGNHFLSGRHRTRHLLSDSPLSRFQNFETVFRVLFLDFESCFFFFSFNFTLSTTILRSVVANGPGNLAIIIKQ